MIYPWLESVWQQIAQHWQQQPHARLLYGHPGIGKREFAEYLAQALLCESLRANHQPCGECTSCHLYSQHSHPDFLLVTPEEADSEGGERKQALIKVETIRNVLDFAHLSAHRGGKRVALIYPAESMNLQAANALLKILEEPPAGMVFILVSHQKDRLLPTIKSRCRQIALTMPARAQALAYVQQQHGDNATDLLAFHGGAPLFADNDSHDQLRNQLIPLLVKPRLIALLDYAAAFDKQKLALSTFLNWLAKWLLDMSLAQQYIQAMYYPAWQDELNKITGQIDPLSLFALIDRVNALAPYGKHTLNVKMQLEDLLIDYLNVWQQKNTKS
ncbi:DNA polymerase III subunit delta' [Snodgrassella communis]|uniref:DNA polymerase III subunit delta' n=1 Tax=Snodgrassella communis TaxID=2946699 RepID=UPI000C1F4AF6|nr:DNA polymerase III subunit delta' [Snodgrassella communis]PIT20895.1 DNA polymerase III subunit delta' [Snodgrassella communis]